MQTTASRTDEENRQIASCLREAAQRLADQGANPYRAGAYRAGANTLDGLDRSVRALFDAGGIDALDALPQIGLGVAQAIAELLLTGRWRQLERLRGDTAFASAFEAVPGIGRELAMRIHDTLHIDTLEDLEAAARTGRLETVSGVGPRRAAGIRAALDEVLSRRRRWHAHTRNGGLGAEPPVELLLHIDRLYRARAAAGTLPTLAPKRLNPEGKAWLPVLHITRGGWHFTALFSNTGRVYEDSPMADWVALFFYDDVLRESERMVVTEAHGELAGKRIVRGREMECRVYYAG
ncbi:helix-hairpin-helix domain-containing protein [Burkholderia stagnalis]|uniref:DNA-binding protein n=1 Tax=Burkholderia stagnalis TaxID=1503054 RepID=A0A108GHF7_9BURK|nr:helix-hairpin-helix domain-containing protein [Burkholderia stagnalis]KVZ02715.1 DNA-binding protein [Burkholderia stagnalis]KWA53829.1 DNA-binding protein [Burkholderia stagnalis]KWA58943.1 DNA-binding protein [Burkholderia stagnalis]KWA60831.1 DNA-binding protein [Burkholderia stagnalis]KWC97707.1 DNA-binding protein [Burkholderia stagnalis]